MHIIDRICYLSTLYLLSCIQNILHILEIPYFRIKYNGPLYSDFSIYHGWVFILSNVSKNILSYLGRIIHQEIFCLPVCFYLTILGSCCSLRLWWKLQTIFHLFNLISIYWIPAMGQALWIQHRTQETEITLGSEEIDILRSEK